MPFAPENVMPKLHPSLFLAFFALCAYSTVSAQEYSQTLVSGQPIPTGADAGPMAVNGISSHPLGTAYLYDSQRPDIFVITGRFGGGLFLYRYIEDSAQGTPIFDKPTKIKIPFSMKGLPKGTIFQRPDKSVHALWCSQKVLHHTIFDENKNEFILKKSLKLDSLPANPESVEAIFNPDNTLEIVVGIKDDVSSKPPSFDFDKKYLSYYRAPEYTPYDGTGKWRGGFPYIGLYAFSLPGFIEGPAKNFRRVSQTDKEVREGFSTITHANLGPGHNNDLITGSHYGGIHYYHNLADAGLNLAERKNIVDTNNIVLRHPAVWPSPLAYYNPIGKYSDLIAGSEGGTYFYSFTGRFSPNNSPIFSNPTKLLENQPVLYGGSLTVPSMSDWDQDGDDDIISGNSQGFVLFYENTGSNLKPIFAPAVNLKAGGKEIHVQPGYNQSIQGPGEARWGYTCPIAADWNNDGLDDILMNDANGKHTVFMNIGSKGQPKLDYGHPLYLDGLDLHGTWRCRPAVAELNGRNVYITLDDDDETHLYEQVDIYNVADCGKLKLADGANIKGNFLDAGGTGRLKFSLCDFDNDGFKDIIIGTPRHGCVPDPEKGLPWQARNKYKGQGSAILFLKNAGSNAQPIFEFPRLVKFKGKPIFLGQHSCGPTPAYFGRDSKPDLIVGTERGRYMYYKYDDLSWDD